MTSINERQYQLPFCQVLAAEGETILYVSSHGPYEKGKDIISKTADGEIRAYQLKMGDIGLSDWRDIYGEIVNLVELPIELPSTGVVSNFSPFLVTNGELTDPVNEQLRASNVAWQSRGINKELRAIQKGELVDRFRNSHGAYLPNDLYDFRTFLELILRDGTSVADKRKASQLFEQIIPFEAELSKLAIQRAAASIVLLTAYISGAAEKAQNHWAGFEYWILAAAYILQLEERQGPVEEAWHLSYSLCEKAAERAISALLQEAKDAPHFVVGSPLVDGHTYSSRMCIMAGLFAAYSLAHRIRNLSCPESDFIFNFIQHNLKNAVMWGESAVPYLLSVSLEAERNCRSDMAEGLLIQLVREIAAFNSLEANGRGLPNVYYSPEEAIKLNAGLDFLNAEKFIGISYTIQTLIDMLARRWRRQALASLWYSITRISLTTFYPASTGEWYRWKVKDGALESRLAAEPQSWSTLCDEAESLSYDNIPSTLRRNPHFAIYFMLVFPQRFCRGIVKLIEDSLRAD